MANLGFRAYITKDQVVQRLVSAEHALSVAVRLDQVKLVLDAAAAQHVFAKRQKLGEDVIAFAHTIKMRALARLGELLTVLEKAGGAGIAGPGRGKTGTRAELVSTRPTLEDLGITKKLSAIAQQLALLPPVTREAIAQRETTFSKARREAKAVELRKTVTLPTAKYRVLYADPPWHYHDKADEGSVQAGGAARHYPTMTITQLCDLPIGSLCEPNAVLFLWTTSPLLFESAAVFKAWGFAYKASFVWDKMKHNMGHYNSVRHEFLLVCTRGSCAPDVVELFDSVQSIERTTHSTKPATFRTIIETLYPHGKRLELFARTTAPGWDVFGNEVEVSAPGARA